jgi:hypothetical protein
VPCPSCGILKPAVALVCETCGHRAARPTRPEAPPRPRLLTTTAGVISTAIGVSGMLLYGPMLALALTRAARSGWAETETAATAATGGLCVLALWLALGGIGLMRRRRVSLAAVRWWSIAKLTAVLVISAWFWRTQPLGGGDAAIAGFTATAIWLALWPLFILIWFRPRAVRPEWYAWR